jgi:hypothetical protein
MVFCIISAASGGAPGGSGTDTDCPDGAFPGAAPSTLTADDDPVNCPGVVFVVVAESHPANKTIPPTQHKQVNTAVFIG